MLGVILCVKNAKLRSDRLLAILARIDISDSSVMVRSTQVPIQ